MKSIAYFCRLNFASLIPRLITSGYELRQDLGFKFVFEFDTVIGETVGSPLGYYNNMLLAWHLTITLAHGKDIWSESHED